jgi:hypothetical protein
MITTIVETSKSENKLKFFNLHPRNLEEKISQKFGKKYSSRTNKEKIEQNKKRQESTLAYIYAHHTHTQSL